MSYQNESFAPRNNTPRQWIYIESQLTELAEQIVEEARNREMSGDIKYNIELGDEKDGGKRSVSLKIRYVDPNDAEESYPIYSIRFAQRYIRTFNKYFEGKVISRQDESSMVSIYRDGEIDQTPVYMQANPLVILSYLTF